MLETFVRKPILATTLAVTLLIFGFFAYKLMPVRLFPLVPASFVTVTTTYPGASPQTMEGFVATPIEQALGGLSGVDYISAANTPGQSVVTLKFFLKSGALDKALPQITNRVQSVLWKLPKGINSPVITKVDPNGGPGQAIMYIGFGSKALTREQVTDYLTRVIKPQIEALPGVASAQIFGGQPYAMRIWIDPRKLAAHNLTATDVATALQAQNENQVLVSILQQMNRVSGLLAFAIKRPILPRAALEAPVEFVVKTNQPYPKLNEAMQALEAAAAKYPGIIAPTVNMQMSQQQVNIDVNRQKAVALGINSQQIADTLAMFLAKPILQFVVMVSVPLAVVGALYTMYLADVTLNIYTKIGLIMLVGLISKHGILIVHFAHREMDKGLNPIPAVIEAASIRLRPILMTTFAMIASAIPLVLAGGAGATARQDIGWVVVGGMALGTVLTLFVVPTAYSLLMRKHHAVK